MKDEAEKTIEEWIEKLAEDEGVKKVLRDSLKRILDRKL